MTTYPFADFFKTGLGFNQLFDVNQLFATQRRNVETASAIYQTFVEGAQAVTRRQAEVLREGTNQALKTSRDLLSGGTPDMTKQADVARDAIEATLENVREVTEMVTKCSFEAFDLLNRRTTDALDELSRASGTAAASKKKAA